MGDFFHIFDLSFIVAGTAGFGAIAFLYLRIGLPFYFPFPGWMAAAAAVICSYVIGLVCFGVGRALNASIGPRGKVFFATLPPAVEMHGLSVPVRYDWRRLVEKALTDDEARTRTDEEQLALRKQRLRSEQGPYAWRLYIWMWQALLDRHGETAAYVHLARYWAMAAMYDGTAMAFVLWAGALLASAGIGSSPLIGGLSVVAAGVACFATRACAYQAARYFEYQIEDLVAFSALKQGP